MRKEDTENLKLAGTMEKQTERGRQRTIYIICVMIELGVRDLSDGKHFLSSKTDRLLRRSIIAPVLKERAM